jgi:hypothetical protein
MQTQAGLSPTGTNAAGDPKPASARFLQPICLGLVGLGLLELLIEAWPLLVAKLSVLQWLAGGMIHLGTLCVVIDACRRREAGPEQMARQIRMLVVCMFVSWTFHLSLLTKLAQ